MREAFGGDARLGNCDVPICHGSAVVLSPCFEGERVGVAVGEACGEDGLLRIVIDDGLALKLHGVAGADDVGEARAPEGADRANELAAARGGGSLRGQVQGESCGLAADGEGSSCGDMRGGPAAARKISPKTRADETGSEPCAASRLGAELSGRNPSAEREVVKGVNPRTLPSWLRPGTTSDAAHVYDLTSQLRKR